MGTVTALPTTHQPPDLISMLANQWPSMSKEQKDAVRAITEDTPQVTRAECEALLHFLNVATGKRFKPVPANIKFCRARLGEYTMEELRAIIALKCRQARKGEFDARYLRPATLLNAEKAAQYYGELET